MTENEPNSQVALEWFDGYHGGWAGNHFDQIVMRDRRGGRDTPAAAGER